jgi:hypothetical protein
MTRPSYLGAIDALNILSDLIDFDPHVAGTPPLNLHTEISDIDILCQSIDLDHLADTLWALYSDRAGFHMWQWATDGRPVIARFTAHTWDFEIFGSIEPVRRQRGWQHFSVEQRLLLLGGPSFRAKVMELRNAGFKTEPAFWSALNQSGEAYSGMLSLFDWSDETMAGLLQDAGFNAPA